MKNLIFDTGPIISLTTNNLLWLLKDLQEHYRGGFCITEAVKKELVDTPLSTKKFKFEALQVLEYIKEGVLHVINDQSLEQDTIKLLNLANSSFKVRGNWMRIVHYAEISGLSACIRLNADTFVVDERTTRLLIENPNRLIELWDNTLHEKIEVYKENLNAFREMVGKIKLIRSAELVTVAYELGLLDKYIIKDVPNPQETLLESVLWGVKLNGCAVSKREIEQILKLERE